MKTGWTIGKKLVVSFLAVAMITLLLGIVGYYGAAESEKSIDEIGVVRLPSVDSLLEIKACAENIGSTLRTLTIAGLSQDIRDKQYKNLITARENYGKAWDIYAPLPQTTEEARLWNLFVPAWDAWRAENNKAIELSKKFDQIGIENPYVLKEDFETFRGDHYRLTSMVQSMLHDHKVFDGGENHTQCNLGKWMGSFETDNPTLKQHLNTCEEPHRLFHAGLAKAKQLIGEGKAEEAQKLYDDQIAPASEKISATLHEMCNLGDQAVATMLQNEKQVLGPVKQTQEKVAGLLKQIVDINRGVASSEVKNAQSNAAFLKILSLVAMIVGVILALGLGLLISRGINRALRRIVDGLTSGSEQTASAAGQVSSASQSLAQGASEQAAALEETTSSIEEMSSMVKQNAANANEATNLAASATADADTGTQAMGQMSKAIDDIKKSSDETAKIIKTIDEIAFQTNLLALNAAVEAARAGEAGKGFAVVAEEVRNLAQRSAQAAKDTANMIAESVKNADNGVSINKEVAQTLNKIAEGSRKVNDLVAEIAAASNEQAQGIDQINTAVGQMDQVTQSNAANAEESASAAEELSSQAEELNGMVGQLQAMVGGKGATSGSRTGNHISFQADRGASHGDKARQKTAHPNRNGGSNSPEDMIPFENEKELSQF